MRTSKFQKSFSSRKKQLSRSEHRNTQLPFINRTIDVISSNPSHITHNQQTFLDKFSWVLVQKNYYEVNTQQIYKEYTQLRKEIFNLNDIVVKELQKFQRKSQRKKNITQIQPEKIIEIRQKQMQNNFFILERMRKQYKDLQTKKQTLIPKQQIESQIQKTKQQINSVRQKINSLKLKNKNIGENIINTDQVLIQLKQAQRQYQISLRKKKQLQHKLEKVNNQTQKTQQNLSKINFTAQEATQFFKSTQQSKKSQQQVKRNTQIYEQKIHSIQILKKNNEIFIGLKQQKYHQLLKQLEDHVQKQNQIKNRTQQIQLNLIDFTDQIYGLQKKLRTVKQESSRFQLYQNSNISREGDSFISSDPEITSKKSTNNPKFNLFPKLRTEKSSSNKNDINKKAANIQVDDKSTNSIIQKKLQKLVQSKLNPQNKEIDKVKSLKTSQTLGSKKQVQQDFIFDNNFKNKELKKEKEHIQKDQQNIQRKQKVKQDGNVKNPKIEVFVKNKIQEKQIPQQKQTKKYLDEENFKLNKKIKNLSKQIDIKQKEVDSSQIQQAFKSESQQIQRKPKTKCQVNELMNKKGNQSANQIRNQQQETIQKQKQQEKPQTEDNKVHFQKLTIDLGKIQKNLQKVSLERNKFKQKIASNLSKKEFAQTQGKQLEESFDL